jgi:hypothetical protein
MNDAKLKTDGESPKQYWKGETKPNAPYAKILVGYGDSSLTDEVHKPINKIARVTSHEDPDSDPLDHSCISYLYDYVECLESGGMSEDDIVACVNCVNDAWPEDETMCDELEEVDYCDNVKSCEDSACNNLCTDLIDSEEACYIHEAGCDENQYASECLSGDVPDSEPSHPCESKIVEAGDCLKSGGMSTDELDDCAICLDETLNDIPSGTMCDELNEVGFCGDVVSCEEGACDNLCIDEIDAAQACFTDNAGCTNNQFETECLSGM